MKNKSNNNDTYPFSFSKSNTLNNNSYHKYRYNYYNSNKKYNRYFNNNDNYTNFTNNKHSYISTYKKNISHKYNQKFSLYNDDIEEDLNIYLTHLNKSNYFSRKQNNISETIVQAQNEISLKEEVFRIKVKINEGNIKEIVLYKDDNVNEIICGFCKENNIQKDVEKGLIDKIKNSLNIVEKVVEKGKFEIK